MKSEVTDFQVILHKSKALLLSIYISTYFAEISGPIRFFGNYINYSGK